ncbi:type VI secretion system-associated protein TagO [Gilliamella apicola]|uniref:type VI secretion system-associated protein TagO n=1 Tax=Gilliamella apicola TaxID=1196095 RepID=UPI002FEDEB83
MKKKLLVLLLPIIFTNFAFAESLSISTIGSCKSINDNEQRLACYDAAFEVNTSVVETNSKSKWVITEEVSPIDDSKTVMLSLKSESPIKSDFSQVIPTLNIQCKERETDFYINFNIFLSTHDIKPITRIDSDKAVNGVEWYISTDYKALFYPGSQKKINEFIKTLKDKKKLFIQVTPFSKGSVNTTFDLTGLDEAIKPVREACNW